MDDLFDILDEPAADAALDFLIYDDITSEDDEVDVSELADLEQELLDLEQGGDGLGDDDLDRELEDELAGLEDDFNAEFGNDEDW